VITVEYSHSQKKEGDIMPELKELLSEREKLQAELSGIESDSKQGISRILEAIKTQRWYFFRNNKYILMDRDTGLLWANLDYFNYQGGTIGNFDEVSGITGWVFPTGYEMRQLISDLTFPFREGEYYRIKGKDYWQTSTGRIDLDNLATSPNKYGWLIPCNRSLIANTHYDSSNPQSTLDLFTRNNLWPKFKADSITELYGSLFKNQNKPQLRKPQLESRLQELSAQIDKLTAHRVLSSEFDYTQSLAQYDITAIASSVIKYFQALQKWTDGLMSLIESYEREKEDTIRESNTIALQLSRKYEDSPALSHEENELLRERKETFRRKFSLAMHTVKAKILAVKRQADELEARIDSTDSLTELAAIAEEPRADFALVAENTARIITNALRKIEYFESHRDFVVNAVKILADWSENFRVFKTTLMTRLVDSCMRDNVDNETFDSWLKDWESLRLEIERKLQPVIEWGLKGDISANESGVTIPERVIAVLDGYKSAVDKFYLDERKSVFQEFEDKPAGNLLEKIKTESMLYDCASEFQRGLQEIIFSCTSPADRIFILNWANSLLDIPLDSIIADDDFRDVSAEILEGFMKLKARNYDVYLSDAKSYGDELSRRNKEYNSLVSRMRKALKKGDAK